MGKLITGQWKSNSAVHCILNDYSAFYIAIWDNRYSEHGDDAISSSKIIVGFAVKQKIGSLQALYRIQRICIEVDHTFY